MHIVAINYSKNMTHIISCKNVISNLNNAEAIRIAVEKTEKFPGNFKEDMIEIVIFTGEQNLFTGEQLIIRHSYEPTRTCDDWHCGSDALPKKRYCSACMNKPWAKHTDGRASESR